MDTRDKGVIYRPDITRGLECYVDADFAGTNNTPAGYPLLNKDENGPARKASWKYRGIIGMLGYLQGTKRPDIAMAIHQCARFNNDTHISH